MTDHGHGMTRVPALPSSTTAPEAQIDAALSVLIRLLAEQTAREGAGFARTEEVRRDDTEAED